MNTTHRVVVISGGLSSPSSSRTLADGILSTVKSTLESSGVSVEPVIVELRQLATDITNHMITGFAPPSLAKVIEQVSSADSIIAVSPVFSGSYSGLFKSFFDILDPVSLEGKPVILGATGGSYRHSLMLEHAMRPLFIYLRTQVMTTAIYASPEDWGKGSTGETSLEGRISRAAQELDRLVSNTGYKPASGSKNISESLPFEQLLAQVQGK